MASAALIGAALACGGTSREPSARTAAEPSQTASPQAVVGTWSGGKLTRAEVDREGARLPPLMKHQLQGVPGRKDLALALIDKRLLAGEAERRGLTQAPEIQRQVRELEERLAIQALLQEEERKAPPPDESELRAWFEAHRDDLATPERVRLSRALVEVKPGAPAAERARAKERAEALAKRARAAAKLEGTDIGFIARGDLHEPELDRAAFALAAGSIGGPVAVKDGFTVIEVIERKPARVPSFEEARAEVRARVEPIHKRRAFDDLRERLRRDGQVRVDEAALR